MVRVWMNHRWLFLSPCPGVTGKPGWDCHLLSPRWQRAGTVMRTGRGNRRIESGLPCGFLRETVSICSSGPNLTVNRFHYFLLYSTVCDLSMHLEHSLSLSKYRTSPHLHSVCVQHFMHWNIMNWLFMAVWNPEKCLFCFFFLAWGEVRCIQFFWQYIVTFIWNSTPSYWVASKVRGSILLSCPGSLRVFVCQVYGEFPNGSG